jgi:ribosomal protein S3AE
MAKIIKKKFFEIEIPILGDTYEALANSVEELNNKVMKMDITRQLKGKSVDMIFRVVVKDHKATAVPKKLQLLPCFIRHMLHPGISYVEDSVTAETKDSIVIIKPFMITRKKVSRAVSRTLRNSSRNWFIDYLKSKTDEEVFGEILSNQIQKPLSLKLKKIYPLAICEIRWFEVKKPLTGKKEESLGTIEIKKEVSNNGEEVSENIEIEEKPKKKKASKKEN